MGVVIRPSFGKPCFLCGVTVPWQRFRILQEHVVATGRVWLKSDLICVDCERRERRAKEVGEVTTTRPRHR